MSTILLLIIFHAKGSNFIQQEVMNFSTMQSCNYMKNKMVTIYHKTNQVVVSATCTVKK